MVTIVLRSDGVAACCYKFDATSDPDDVLDLKMVSKNDDSLKKEAEPRLVYTIKQFTQWYGEMLYLNLVSDMLFVS